MRPTIRRSAGLVLLALVAGPLSACGGTEDAYPRQPYYDDWETRPMRDPYMRVRPPREPIDNGGWTDEQMRNARPMPLGEDSGRRCDEGFGNDPNCAPAGRRGSGRSSLQGSSESPVR